MRFSSDQRLRRQNDFRAVRAQGRRVDCGVFTLWWRTREGTGAGPVRARLGVVASTAAVGPATHRNAARRRLREIFRRHQEMVPADVDLLLVARAALNRLQFREVEQRFVEACRRLAVSNHA